MVAWQATARTPPMAHETLRYHGVSLFIFLACLFFHDGFVREVADHPALQLLSRGEIAILRNVLEVHVGVGRDL